ncbi:uncharacterized protein LOC111885168 isoform X1 [Lactuca sativa]|uniref:uncharacterized protein LOC111885168 isoform X1 n=1 Tax=Lactuca sativa TaxID=4236 RepID=UPI000CD8EB1D|nr:uncharacterized protein LOC111885168 isoform X1 [Lactuca sativa]
MTAVSEREDSSMPTLTSQSSNCQAILNPYKYPKYLQIMVECMKCSFLNKALSTAEEVPRRIVTLAFTTAIVNKGNDTVSFELQGGKRTTISKTDFAKLLCLPTEGPYVTPTSEELIDVFNSMGHEPYMKKVSDFKKSRLPAVWSLLFGFILRGLTSRTGGLDAGPKELLSLMYGLYKGVNVDFATVLWNEFVDSIKHSKRATELSAHRFWALIVSQAYEFHKIPIDESEVPKTLIHQISIPTKADQSHFSFVGQIPEEMLSLIKCPSRILDQYRASLIIPYPVRPTPQPLPQEDVQITRVTRMTAQKRKTPFVKVEAVRKSKRVKQPKIVEESVVEEEDEQQHHSDSNFEEDIPITTTQTIVKTSLVETIPISTSTTPAETTLVETVPISEPVFETHISKPMSISEPLTILEEEEEEEVDGFVLKAGEDPSFDDVVDDFEMAAFGEGLVDSDEEDDEDDNQSMSKRDFKKLNRKLNVVLRSLDSNTQSAQYSNQEKMLADWSVMLSDQNKKIDSLTSGFDLFKAHVNIEINSQMTKVQKVMLNECKKLLDEISKMREENEKSLNKVFGDLKSEHENSLKSLNESLTEAKQREITLQNELTKALAHIEFLRSYTSVVNPMVSLSPLKQGGEGESQELNLKIQDIILMSSKGTSSFQPSTSVPLPSFEYTLPYTISNTVVFPVSTQFIKSIPFPLSKSLLTGSTAVTTMPLLGSEPTSKGKEKIEVLSKEKLRQRKTEERKCSQLNFDAEYVKGVAEEEKMEAENRVKLIRSLGFSENTVFDLVPKESYSVINSLEKQIDFPISPRAYGYPIMGPKINENIGDSLYNERLVRFYALVGKPLKYSWSPKMIRSVESVMKTESFENVFQNFKFVVRRDIMDDITFTIADFPNLNPHDLVVLLKLSKEWGLKPNSVVMQSIKAFLCYYYRDIARTDIVLAGAINQKVKLPNKDAEGMDNIGGGEMVTEPTWGSTYSVRVAGGRSRKVFFRMNEKERFPNNVLEGMIQRIMLNSKNSEPERKKAVDMLRWWLKVREVLLELVPILFPELKKD